MKTILVPLDLSAASSRVCGAACALAKLTHARLVLLNVVLPPFPGMNDYYALDGRTIAEGMAAAEEASTKQLKRWAKWCEQRKVRAQIVCITEGAVPVILAQARRLKASYIVMGSHGHGGVFELLIGSTTSGVLRKAKCPVVVVPVARA